MHEHWVCASTHMYIHVYTTNPTEHFNKQTPSRLQAALVRVRGRVQNLAVLGNWFVPSFLKEPNWPTSEFIWVETGKPTSAAEVRLGVTRLCVLSDSCWFCFSWYCCLHLSLFTSFILIFKIYFVCVCEGEREKQREREGKQGWGGRRRKERGVERCEHRFTFLDLGKITFRSWFSFSLLRRVSLVSAMLHAPG